MIQVKVEEGVWKPLRASRGGIKVFHLFFADDLMLFAEVAEDLVLCILEGMHAFCKVLGQRVTFHKLQVFFSPNLPDQMTEPLSKMLGVPRTTQLGLYLGHYLLDHGRNNEGPKRLLQWVKTDWRVGNQRPYQGPIGLPWLARC